MQFISNNNIIIQRELSELDLFTINFVKILRKYTLYVVVSGYVAILLGRSRASEDVDIIIPKLPHKVFEKLILDLKKDDFYCLQTDDVHEMYDYLNDNFAVRFAKNKTVIPNIELKFAKNNIDAISLQNTVKIKLNDEEIITSALELQIAFKEEVLKSPKDIEDARHIRLVAQEHLNIALLNEYKRMLHDTY